MQMNSTISVIIPLYNRFEALTHVVQSILAQTLPVLEIIVIDDGSKDHRPEDIERYIQARPEWRERVRYIYQENQGQSRANNRGIAEARGEWLAFNGHDDLWLPWKLEWQMRALGSYGDECGLCFTDAWFINNPYMKSSVFQSTCKQFNEVLGILRDPIRLAVKRPIPMWMQTVVARADLVRAAGGLDEQLRYCDDHDFFFRMSLITKFCFVNMPMVLIDRAPAADRHTGESRNWHKEEFCLRMDQRCYEKQMQLGGGLAPEIQKSIRKNLRSNQSAWANWYLMNGEPQKAREAITRASKYELTPRVGFKWLLMHLVPNWTRSRLNKWYAEASPRYDRVSWQTNDSGPSAQSSEAAQAAHR